MISKDMFYLPVRGECLAARPLLHKSFPAPQSLWLRLRADIAWYARPTLRHMHCRTHQLPSCQSPNLGQRTIHSCAPGVAAQPSSQPSNLFVLQTQIDLAMYQAKSN